MMINKAKIDPIPTNLNLSRLNQSNKTIKEIINSTHVDKHNPDNNIKNEFFSNQQ